MDVYERKQQGTGGARAVVPMDSFTFKELTAEQVTALEQIHDAEAVKE